MVYYDMSGRPIRRRLKRRATPADRPIDEITRLVFNTAKQNPNLTPEEVYAELHRQGHDITKLFVEALLT